MGLDPSGRTLVEWSFASPVCMGTSSLFVSWLKFKVFLVYFADGRFVSGPSQGAKTLRRTSVGWSSVCGVGDGDGRGQGHFDAHMLVGCGPSCVKHSGRTLAEWSFASTVCVGTSSFSCGWLQYEIFLI